MYVYMYLCTYACMYVYASACTHVLLIGGERPATGALWVPTAFPLTPFSEGKGETRGEVAFPALPACLPASLCTLPLSLSAEETRSLRVRVCLSSPVENCNARPFGPTLDCPPINGKFG